MKESIRYLVVGIFDMILILVILWSIVFSFVYFYEKYSVTPRFGKTFEKPVKYNFGAGGCLIKDNNNWIRCEKYIEGMIEIRRR